MLTRRAVLAVVRDGLNSNEINSQPFVLATDAFELWCWRRLLRAPWTAKRSNQSVLKEISPEYSFKGLILKLKLQYFGHLMWRTDSVDKSLTLGKLKVGGKRDNRGWDGWMASPTQWTWVWVNSGSWWLPGKPGVLQSMGSQKFGQDWVTELTDLAIWRLQFKLWGRLYVVPSRVLELVLIQVSCVALDNLFASLSFQE